ncbi:MAG: ABC transporter substrate-binding protein [Dehalococcoidia bacterium]|nr:ABC transporter substrate-binding protein [Dehalococcoidia bacterium]
MMNKLRVLTAITRACLLLVVMAVVLAACAPAATSTPPPTKAAPPPAATATTAPSKVEATKPAEKPAGTATPPAAAKATGKPIRIPLIAPFTGPGGTFGNSFKFGALVAQDDLNASGGIGGYPLEIALTDDQMAPKEAVTVMRTAAEKDKAVAILGPMAQAPVDVAIPIANELQVPMITYAFRFAGSPPYKPWVFRIGPSDDVEANLMLAALKKVYPQVKKVLIVGDVKEKATEYWTKSIFPQSIRQAGLNLIDTVAFESGTTDFGAIVTKIKDLAPDAIAYAGGAASNPVGFANELVRQGVKVPVTTPHFFAMGGFVERSGGAMDGWVFGWSLDPNRPDLKDIVARFMTKAKGDSSAPPGYRPMLDFSVYDTVMMLAKVMRDAKITPDTDVQKARALIADGMRGLKSFNGLMGNITMNENQDADWEPAVLIVKNGSLASLQ